MIAIHLVDCQNVACCVLGRWPSKCQWPPKPRQSAILDSSRRARTMSASAHICPNLRAAEFCQCTGSVPMSCLLLFFHYQSLFINNTSILSVWLMPIINHIKMISYMKLGWFLEISLFFLLQLCKKIHLIFLTHHCCQKKCKF